MNEPSPWQPPHRRGTGLVVLGSVGVVGGLLFSVVLLVIGLFGPLICLYLSILAFTVGPIVGGILLVMGILRSNRAWSFNAPPGWPAPSPGWMPPPGWQPDPAWPVPPPDWRFWLPR